MPIKILDKYTLPDKEIEKMKELIVYTDKLEMEHAGRLCSKSENFELKIINMTFGNAFCVSIPKRCKSGYRSVGIFHTHVTKKGKDIISLSIPDIENHVASKHIMDILGVNNNILCYTRKKLRNFEKNITNDIENIREKIDLARKDECDESNTIKNMRSKLAHRLTVKYFNIMKI